MARSSEAVALGRIFDAESIDDVRIELGRTFDADADIKERYRWSHKVIYETTGDYIANFLVGNPPSEIPSLNQVDVNLRSAASELDQCISRQDAIFQVESDCISAVVDALNADRIFQTENTLSVNQARVNAKALGLSLDDVKTEVDKKYAILRKVFDFKHKFYGAKDGPFNFAERVEFLRDVQAFGVRSVLEKLFSVRRGLGILGITTLETLPEWKVGSTGVLLKLAKWVRTALRSLEILLKAEHTLSISLTPLDEFLADKDGAPLSAENLVKVLREAGTGEDQFTMTLSKAQFEKASGLKGLKSFRLVSMAVGVIYGHHFDPIYANLDNRDKLEKALALDATGRLWRSELRFSLRFQPPNQTAALKGGESVDWKPKKVFLDANVPVSEIIDPTCMAALPSSLCANLDPTGKWLITLLEEMVQPQTRNAVYGKNFNDPSDHVKIKGIAIHLTVAVTQ